MVSAVLIALGLLLVAYASLSIRVAHIQAQREKGRTFEERTSPLAQALKDFVAVAGGVYLGLSALAEFLKVPVPVKTELWGLAFDPLAAVAVLLAVVAPFLPVRRSL